MEKIQETLETLIDRFDSLSKDVDHLKEREYSDERLSRSRSASHRSPRSRSASLASVRDRSSTPASGGATMAAGPSRKRSWEDRMMRDPDERPDYDESIHWPEDEAESNPNIRTKEVSKTILRRVLYSRHPLQHPIPIEGGGLPTVPSSRTPKLDNFLKSEVSSNCKTSDKELVRIQHHMLDALAPLSAITRVKNN